MTRRMGAGFVILGGLLAAAPFVSWYRVDLPGREVRFRGVDVAGELWSLLILGAVIAAMGVAVLVGRADPGTRLGRWAGGVVAVAGLMALAWAVKGVFDIRAAAIPVVPGQPAPIDATGRAYLAAGLCAVTTAVGLLWLRAGTDRP